MHRFTRSFCRSRELRRKQPQSNIENYEFEDWDGRKTTLSDLFSDKDRLILIHNMGKNCSYCTMWADGFIGLYPHIASKAAFVITSPDLPEVQKEFALFRGWEFPMVSAAGTNFIDDMGFLDPDQGYMPGASVFAKKSDDTIVRVGRTVFEPGDDYCALWHFFDLLPEGTDGWEPRFSYTD